jgi:hypothetical protein
MDDVYGKHRKARDRTQIDPHDSLEIRYWATMLHCMEAELQAALDAVGPNTDDVRKYLEES